MTREERREWRQKRLEDRRAARGDQSLSQNKNANNSNSRVSTNSQRKGCGCSRSKG
jgi:hypothetical protein